MKKYCKILLILFIMLFSIGKVSALTVDNKEVTVSPSKNEEVSLSLKTEEKIKSLKFSITWNSYDISAKFKSNYKYSVLDSISYVIKFDEAVSGDIDVGSLDIKLVEDKGNKIKRIDIWDIVATLENGKEVKYNNLSINVNIETDKVETSKLLERIESNIIKITLEENVFEYNVDVNSNILELDLKPISKDPKASVDITSQKLVKGKENQIIISVTDQNNEVQEYVINVTLKKELEKIEIDNGTFEVDTSYKSKWGIYGVFLVVALIAGIIISVKNK